MQKSTGRHNIRDMDTIGIIGAAVHGIDGKRLKYDDLVGASGLNSGARVMTA